MAKAQSQQQEQQERTQFLASINRAAQDFLAAAPLSVHPDQQKQALDRVAVAFRAIAARQPKVYAATPASIGRCMALSALTNLVPGGPLPHVDLIPREKWRKDESGRWVRDAVELDWQIGWRGYIELAARAGCRARPVAVYTHERFVWEEGLESNLEHRPDPSRPEYGSWEALVGVYVVVRYRDGTKDFVMLPRSAIEERRAVSQAWRTWSDWKMAKDKGEPLMSKYDRNKPMDEPDCPWVTWPIEQALKTGIRYAASRGVLAFDDQGVFGFGEDARGDVLDARTGNFEPSARTAVVPAAGRVPEPEAPRLPNNNWLDEEPDDFAGVDPREDQREKVEAKPEPERVRVDPGVRDVVGGGRQETTPEDMDREVQAADDATALQEAIAKRYPDGWKTPLSKEAAVTLLKEALGKQRLNPADRYDFAAAYGVRRKWWAVTGTGALVPLVDVSRG
jgi:recombinational DNA repair protein RecT